VQNETDHSLAYTDPIGDSNGGREKLSRARGGEKLELHILKMG